jgi:hypothetical protein
MMIKDNEVLNEEADLICKATMDRSSGILCGAEHVARGADALRACKMLW